MNYVKLLNNYSKEHHLKYLYSNFEKIDFKINPIKNSNWNNAICHQQNQIPYVALTHLIDSYYCLPERPDMAFTYIWKAINNSYVKLGKNQKIPILIQNDANSITSTKQMKELSDSEGISLLKESIYAKRNNVIKNAITLDSLLKDYISLIPLKTLNFFSNIILKGFVRDAPNFPTLANNSTYYTIKKNYPNLHNAITTTYGASYRRISNPIMSGINVNLQITDNVKSRKIIHSLSMKLKELLTNQLVVLSNSNSTNHITVRLTDKELIDFMLKIVLYTIRNNSVHGNLAERLNSDYANKDSLKASIYVYFIAHYFFSLSLYVNNEISLTDLDINCDNLTILKQILD